MVDKSQQASPYEPEKFIDRESEIDQILALLRHPQPRVRAIVIDGDRGVGKTWLALHLHRTSFREIRGLTSWLFSLWCAGEHYQPWGDEVQANEHFVLENEKLNVDKFLAELLNSLGIELPSSPALAERVEAIRQYVQVHRDERYVLILDSAYESDWSLLEQLETHFLGNLLTLDNFFVIVTGRGRPYPWQIPYLIEAVRFGLGKFSAEQIEEQLEKFGLASVLSTQDIYDIGNGWPLFTEYLAHARDRTEALDVAAEILFAVVPRQERGQIRRYFEALCPLDGFSEVEAALMVRTYEKDGVEDGRVICKKMNETRLISWKDGKYVINEPVQNILRQYMLHKNKEMWIRLHCAAYHHFETKANDRAMERFRPFFEDLMQSHASVLAAAGIGNPQTCRVNNTEEAQS